MKSRLVVDDCPANRGDLCAAVGARVVQSRCVPAIERSPPPRQRCRHWSRRPKREHWRKSSPSSGPAVRSSLTLPIRRPRAGIAEVFTAAVAERWQLVDQGATGKVLVIGNEEWPFPVPLARDTNGWRFDTAAGKEEVLARRIGRNELAAIRICRTYVVAQQLYALRAHDGKPAGLYATSFRSEPGRQNGLYWPAAAGQRRSPLGDLMAQCGGGRPSASRRGRAADALSRLLLQDPAPPRVPRRPAERRTIRSTAGCPAGSRSSPGLPSTM